MRIARLINLIMLLLRREMVSATELARLFEVSTRTIYRDVETLSLAGIPIYSTRGRHGGIGLMPTYKVDKKLLNAADISNLVFSLASVSTFITSPEIEATIKKIHAMYAADQHLNDVLIEQTNWAGAKEIKTVAETIGLAIKHHQLVTFTYSDREGQLSERKIEPYQLNYKGERWYVQGFSLERQGFRMFRLSRMLQLSILNEQFQPRAFPTNQFAVTNFPMPIMHPLKVKVNRLARDTFVERFGSQTIIEQNQNDFTAKIELPNNESTHRLLLSFGQHLTILSRGILENSFKNYLTDLHFFS
jgi:predicted DNA-binding transcriptional regulator YafY